MPKLEATPKHLFSWGFHLRAGRDHVATLDMSWMREGGSFEWEGGRYTLKREGWMSGDFLLQHQGQTLAAATKPSVFQRRFEVRVDGREWVLRAASPLTRRFVLEEGGVATGGISPRHPFTRSSEVDFPENLPVPFQVFLFWLAAILWRRADSGD